jgi:hypothetical protein
MTQTDLAEILSRLGRWGEALPLLEAAESAYVALRKKLPDDPEVKRDAERHGALLARARKEAVARR